MIFDGVVCPIPILSNTRRVKVGVFAGDLATTTPAQVIAMKSILSDGGIPADPPPDVYNQIMEKLNGFSGGGEGTEERLDTLEAQMAELLYTPISITSFSHNAGTKEMGSTVTSVTLSWATNKKPTSLTLDGSAIDVSLKSTTLTGLSITSGKTWSLKATDERGAEASKATSVSFLNGVYYGAGVAPADISSAFILGLAKTLTSTRVRSITVNATDGQYVWYCLPIRLGSCKFTVGGFEGGFDLVATTDFTNASGYTESYYVYRSTNAGLGNTTVGVS